MLELAIVLPSASCYKGKISLSDRHSTFTSRYHRILWNFCA
ncbi:hypothetical protein [Nostoc sp.]